MEKTILNLALLAGEQAKEIETSLMGASSLIIKASDEEETAEAEEVEMDEEEDLEDEEETEEVVEEEEA